jgi:hypothetical protein
VRSHYERLLNVPLEAERGLQSQNTPRNDLEQNSVETASSSSDQINRVPTVVATSPGNPNLAKEYMDLYSRRKQLLDLSDEVILRVLKKMVLDKSAAGNTIPVRTCDVVRVRETLLSDEKLSNVLLDVLGSSSGSGSEVGFETKRRRVDEFIGLLHMSASRPQVLGMSPLACSEAEKPEAHANITPESTETEASDADMMHDSSDEEDLFIIEAARPENLSKEYKTSPKERWRLAAEEVKTLCRSDVTIPLDPFDKTRTKVFQNLDEAFRLPRWHCPFRHCAACEMDKAHSKETPKTAHEASWWDHIWTCHHADLSKIIRKYKLQQKEVELLETMFALLIAGMLEREREFITTLGIATDRRILNHVGEVFYEDNIKTLMCFICGCKHCYHIGFDKFGRSYNKGSVDIRTNKDVRLHAILHGAANGDVREAWEYNLSYKRFKTHFGRAVELDPDLQEGSWEWRRRVRGCSREHVLLCNPEDVTRSKNCKHDAITVCHYCNIPICNQCWRLAAKFQKIPKALANDNYIGYMNRYLIAQKVTWFNSGFLWEIHMYVNVMWLGKAADMCIYMHT